MGCFSWIVLLIVGILVMLSMIRWFDQITEAVDRGWWNKVAVLVMFPPGVWFFPSRVGAGRPTAVPLHEPVRGFGKISSPRSEKSDEPPPGTPKEFLAKPVIPPPRVKKSAADADKLAKLRQKMIEQGMLPRDDEKDEQT